MATAMKTPGVYIVEKNAFPNSVVEVATAVPAFIGYTETADNKGAKITGPWRISSMSEFQTFFGGPPSATFAIADASGSDAAFFLPGPNKTRKGYSVKRDASSRGFLLYYSMMLFFQNGGGPCWIVSVGDYKSTPGPDDLKKGIDLLLKEMEPTMVVIPDALLLPQKDCIGVQQAALTHCGRSDVRSRVAILDIYNGFEDQTDAGDNCITQFRNKLGTDNLDFGAAYYPWLNTTVVSDRDLGYQNVSNLPALKALLPAELSDIADQLSSADPTTFTLGFLKQTKDGLKDLTDPDVKAFVDAAGKAPAPTAFTPVILTDFAGADLTALAPATVTKDAVQEIKDAIPASPADFTLGSLFDAKTALTGVTAPPGVKAFFDAIGTALADPKTMFPDELLNKAVNASQTLLHPTPGKAPTLDDVEKAINAAKPITADAAIAAVKPTFPAPGLTDPQAKAAQAVIDTMQPDAATVLRLNNTLTTKSDAFVKIRAEMERQINLLPPSGAMAGVYTRVDNTKGVWKAPANESLNMVDSPAVNISDAIQEDLNVTIQGKSINAIRSFVGEGTLVWGARTLDGNSLDWRYVNVRRTMIFLEQSVKSATKAYVFENNVSTTWVTIKSMIRNFLTSVWKRGGLAGASPDDAFQVLCGLGETMTGDDILEGILRVTVLVALVRPAEFIEITFQQQMQKS